MYELNGETVMLQQKRYEQYWRENLRCVRIFLVLWFVVGILLSVLSVEWLNTFHIAGFKIGFWFAQQGGIFFFILLAFFYGIVMNRIDRKYNYYEE